MNALERRPVALGHALHGLLFDRGSVANTLPPRADRRIAVPKPREPHELKPQDIRDNSDIGQRESLAGKIGPRLHRVVDPVQQLVVTFQGFAHEFRFKPVGNHVALYLGAFLDRRFGKLRFPLFGA